MSSLKKGLMMAGASVVALGMFMPGAQAFTNLNWDYDLDVDGWVDIDIDIKSKLDPSGLVAVEALQIHLGDAKAKSIVTGVTNNAPNGQDVQVPVDLGSVSYKGINGSWDNSGGLVDQNGNPLAGDKQCGGFLGTSCTIDLGTATVTVEGVGDVLYAPVQLPEVVSTATAVGNNLSIEAPTFTTFDVTQGLTGDYLFDAAKINADSWVWSIQNASVDSAATAVGNNLSVNLEAAAQNKGWFGGDDDLIVIGDLTQLSHANVSATSFVADVGVTNYTGLGSDLGRALVSSVATAVGNNGSISVSVGGGNNN